jgi:hypothetical protein
MDAVDGRRIGTAFVYGDLLWQSMQVDGTLHITLCCSLVALGGVKEVNRVVCLVHSTIQVFPLTIDFDICFVRRPARTHRTLASAKDMGQDQQNLQCPAVHGGVIQKDATLMHHLLDVAQARRVAAYQRAHTSMTSKG